MNENVVFETRKLKRMGIIHGYFTRDGVVHIKLSEHDRPLKLFIKIISVSIQAVYGKLSSSFASANIW